MKNNKEEYKKNKNTIDDCQYNDYSQENAVFSTDRSEQTAYQAEGNLMDFYPEERIALFIDGANLYAAARAAEYDIDYKKLLQFFRSKARLVRAFYYTALIEDQDYSPIRPLIDWLDYNGYTMVTKPTKEFTNAAGHRKIKGNMDVELTTDMLEMAEKIDHAVLFSGDGDFRRLIEAVQRKGTRVTVISTIHSAQPMTADELRRQADCFIDLGDLRDEIGREGGLPSDGRYDENESETDDEAA